MLFDIGQQDLRAFAALADVELQYPYLPPERRDFLRRLIGGVAPAVAVQHDVEAVTRQTQGNRTAYAAAGTGDQYCFTHTALSSRNVARSGGWNTVSIALAMCSSPSAIKQSNEPKPFSACS